MRFRIFLFGLIVLVLNISASSLVQAQSDGVASNSDQVLLTEDFNSYKDGAQPLGWWVEGGEAAYVRDGKLMIEADPKRKRGPGYVATVWYDKQFSGDIQVEFDAQVVASSLNVNNINFFLYFTHPSGDSTLYETRDRRSAGMYDKYYNLNGYIFTFVNSGKPDDTARFRMRRCPNFELINENFAYQSRPDKTYHITIRKQGNKLTYAVDGTVYLQKTDNKYNWDKGFLGLRTYHTDLWFDNLKVMRLSGKWHLTPPEQLWNDSTNSASTKINWPSGKGFQNFYGWLSGWTDQYNPSGKGRRIIEGGQPANEANPGGEHVSEEIVTRAVDYLEEGFNENPEQPQFLYLAFGATHAPIQVPQKYIDKYEGMYDKGWDKFRLERFKRQKRIGVIPQDAVLTASHSNDPAWNSFSEKEQEVFGKFMEVYAGFLEHTDAQVGRLIDYLKKSGQYKNTLIFLLSDNGAPGWEGILNIPMEVL